MRKTFAAVAALAALTLAPLPLSAQGVKGGDRQAATRDGTCTDQQRVTIRRAFADARQMTNAAAPRALLRREPGRRHREELPRHLGRPR